MKQRGSIGVIDLVYLSVVLVIAVSIYTSIDLNTSTAGWTGAAQAAKGNTSSTVYSGFNVLAQSPTLVSAVVILGILMVLVTRR